MLLSGAGSARKVGDVREGQRGLTIQLGAAVLHAVTDPGYPFEHDLCPVAIDPQALQVWAFNS